MQGDLDGVRRCYVAGLFRGRLGSLYKFGQLVVFFHSHDNAGGCLLCCLPRLCCNVLGDCIRGGFDGGGYSRGAPLLCQHLVIGLDLVDALKAASGGGLVAFNL